MTDYFTMMRDTVGSFGKGVEQRREREYQDERRAREKVIQKRQDDEYDRAQGIQKRSDDINAEERAMLEGPAAAVAPTSYNNQVTAGNAVTQADDYTQPFVATRSGLAPGVRDMGAPAPQGLRPMGAPANTDGAFDPASPAGQSRMTGLAIRRAVNEGRDAAPLYARKREADDEAFIATSMKSYQGSPEQIEAGIQHINKSSRSLSLTDPDKNGFVRGTVVDANGKAQYLKLSKQDQAVLFAAGELMDRNPAKALQMMAGVNKTLAEAMAAENGMANQAATLANQAATGSNQASHNAGMLGVARTNAATNADYKDRQIQVMDDQAARRSEAAGLQGKFDSLTPAQQNGPEGEAIIRQFNMLNVKDGQPLSLSGSGRGAGGGSGILKKAVDQKKNDDGTYTAFDKATGIALYNTFNGKPLPFGMEVSEYKSSLAAASKAGVAMELGENNGKLEFRYIGADGMPHMDIKTAEKARPKEAAPKPKGLTKPTQPVSQTAPQAGLVKPPHYIGIENDSRRGSPGYTFRGQRYPTEQDALAAYYQTIGR